VVQLSLRSSTTFYLLSLLSGLWNYALQLKIEKETVLSSDASFTIRLFSNIVFPMYFLSDGNFLIN